MKYEVIESESSLLLKNNIHFKKYNYEQLQRTYNHSAIKVMKDLIKR